MHLMLHGNGMLEFLSHLNISCLNSVAQAIFAMKAMLIERPYGYRGVAVVSVSITPFVYQMSFQRSCENVKPNI